MKMKILKKIDKLIINLYSMIGIKINDKKSGISSHGNIIIPESLNKYPRITKDNKYKYLGLKIYEINENKENEEFIIEKINNGLEIIKKLNLNNRTTIKCINTQIISIIRYYIGLVVFTVQCLERIDKIIRKCLI